MPQVLTTSAQVVCNHGGGALLSGNPKLKVNGTPVLLQSGIGQITSPPCTLKPAPSSPTPDLTITIAAGQSQKLMANGSPVMLSTLTGTGDATPTPGTISGSDSQTKLMAT